MKASDDLYLDRYEGWYSIRDEAFYDESETTLGEGGIRLSPQGTPVEWTVEESWFFRLSKYQDFLIELNETPGFLEPESRRNEVLGFLKGNELRDLSVSRTSFDWGVPVPDSPGHVMYVWVDALCTYLTGIGYPEASGDFERFWPADIHLIGKDIVRFHAVYWPAFLKSAGLPLPKNIFGHGFLLHRGEKMSKSLGNVVDPLELADRFGVDALRYFLLREVSFGQDGSYSAEAIVTRCNAELANSFGNLAQRVLSFIAKNLDGEMPVMDRKTVSEADENFLVEAELALGQFAIEMKLLNLDRAIQSWMGGVFAANAYVDAQAPWALRKTDPDRMKVVLGVLVTVIRDLALAISPIVPQGAEKVLTLMGDAGDRRFVFNSDGGWEMNATNWRNPDHRVIAPTAAFPRLDMPASEAE